ncbi:hypothetical protein [Paenibacillus sp. FSL R7-0652]|uniref:hypothetical protein n=1 Tax=Paenibacillus sp. FSL R7-0652 TaxID=2921687 RepID=UPI00315B33E0
MDHMKKVQKERKEQKPEQSEQTQRVQQLSNVQNTGQAQEMQQLHEVRSEQGSEQQPERIQPRQHPSDVHHTGQAQEMRQLQGMHNEQRSEQSEQTKQLQGVHKVQHSQQVDQLWDKQDVLKTDRLQALLDQKPLSLIVSLPANDPALARAAKEEGADALKVHYNVGHRASGSHFGPLDEYTEVFDAIRSEFGGPLGVVPSGSIEGTRREDVERLAGMGFDFYSIYAHHLPSFMLRDLGLASTFAINDEYDPSLVAGAAHFGFTALEASIVPGKEYGTPLSFADVLHYRRLVQQAGIPVLVPSQRKLVPEDIPVLHHSGVKAIMLGAIVTGKTEDQLRRAVSNFRNAMDRLAGRDGL